MTRLRIAQLLAVVATLAVLGTTAVALVAWADGGHHGPGDASGDRAGGDQPAGDQPAAVVVRDPRTGATFEVPRDRWRVRDRSVRVYYEDDAGRPVAVVRGPAVFRSGYCADGSQASSRAFAGFTQQDFRAWAGAIGHVDGRTASRIELADGTAAWLLSARVTPAVSGPCGAPQVYVAMVRAGEVRVVLVADAGAPGTLPAERVEAIVASLRL